MVNKQLVMLVYLTYMFHFILKTAGIHQQGQYNSTMQCIHILIYFSLIPFSYF